MEPITEIYDEAYLKRIHGDALRVLEEVGVKCVSMEIRKIFEDTGLAAYDDTTGHIHILKPLVEQTLATAPKGTVTGYPMMPSVWEDQPLSSTTIKRVN